MGQSPPDAIANERHVVGNRRRGAGPECAGQVPFRSSRRPIGHEEPGTAALAAPEGAIYFVFQQAKDCQAPVWPPADGRQRPMMHLDFQVADLGPAVAGAETLGATLSTHRLQENVRVLLDPAGHPFCLCRDDG